MVLSTLPKEIGAIRSLMDKARRTERKIVFYSESAIYYLYYESFIDYLLNNSDEIITYITSDPEDPVFDKTSERFKILYISNPMMAFATGLLDTDAMVFTMTDLGNYHINRSRKEVDHVYVFHAIMSTHMIYRKAAFDHYDTIFCVGPHHFEEIRAHEKYYCLQKKRLVKVGYPLLERLHVEHRRQKAQKKGRFENPVVLIAPTWSRGNIVETCIDDLTAVLLKANYRVVLRPHPEIYKQSKNIIEAVITKYKGSENFEVDTALTSVKNFHRADVMITDWSGIALEYAFGTERPVLFVNTPKKIHNREYQNIAITPIEVSLREKIGRVVNLDEVSSVVASVKELLARGKSYQSEIVEARGSYIYNWGRSAEAGGQYLLHTIGAKSREFDLL